jgi:hypothetical protein
MAKIDEGTLAIIRETARETAEEVIRQHREMCPINDLKNDVYGISPGVGMKGKLGSIDKRVVTIEGRGVWFAGVLSSVLSSGIMGFVCWLLFIYSKK